MPSAIRVIAHKKHVRVKAVDQKSFDVQELASKAADALEGYRQAPWHQLSERTRMAKLHRAIELLKRIEGIESGRIPKPVFGD